MVYSRVANKHEETENMNTTRILTIVIFAFFTTNCGGSNDILGKWHDEIGSSIEFLKDGKIIYLDNRIGQTTGRWEDVGDGRISLAFSGILGLVGEQICQISIENKILSLSNCLLSGSFKKM